MAASQAQSEEQKLYVGLVANPASEIRKEAQLKVQEYQDTINGYPSGKVDALFSQELAGAKQWIRWGDELRGSTNATDRRERRRLYARAFLRARQAQAMLVDRFGALPGDSAGAPS